MLRWVRQQCHVFPGVWQQTKCPEVARALKKSNLVPWERLMGLILLGARRTKVEWLRKDLGQDSDVIWYYCWQHWVSAFYVTSDLCHFTHNPILNRVNVKGQKHESTGLCLQPHLEFMHFISIPTWALRLALGDLMWEGRAYRSMTRSCREEWDIQHPIAHMLLKGHQLLEWPSQGLEVSWTECFSELVNRQEFSANKGDPHSKEVELPFFSTGAVVRFWG